MKVRDLIITGILFLLCNFVMAEGPTWWTERSVLTADPVNDNAPVVLGQLKLMANEAYNELTEKVPLDESNPVRTALENQLNTWLPDGVENAVANVGQVKRIGSLVYDWLIEVGYTNAYPWTDGPAQDPEDFAMALIGQVKFIFNFELPERPPTINYVSPNSASPTYPYRTWETAAYTIQEALNAIGPNGTVVVGDGIYNTGATKSPDEGMYSFNRIVIGEGITVRSVNGPELTTIRGSTDVRCAYLHINSRLEGFTLTQGRTLWSDSGAPNDCYGGGALCEDVSAVISNCYITGNEASGVGGGVYGGTVEFCTINGNTALYGGGVGDAVSRSCLISDNNAYYYDSESGTYGNGSGGGAYGGSLRNCLVLGNRSDGGDSGGINNAIVESCTIVGNSASQYGGVANCSVVNSIIYNNSGSDGYNYAPGTVISYSCTEPLADGEGNIDSDPLFMQTTRGQYDLAVDSPCIDAGYNELWMDDATDVSGLDRKINGTVDMGAYESQGGSRDLGSMEEIPLEDAAGLETGAIVSQQTFTINEFRGGWDQLYITSNPYGAGDIHLIGLNIYVSINGGTPVVLGGSCSDGYNLTERFPEIDGTVAVTISLVYDGSGAFSADSLSLVKWSPRLTVDWGLSNDYIFVGESFTINLSIPEEPPLPGVPVRVHLASDPVGAVTFSETPVTLSIHPVTATAALAGPATIMAQTTAGAILAQTSVNILGRGIVVDSAGSAVKWDDECSGFGDKTEWTAGIKISLQGPTQNQAGILKITGNSGSVIILDDNYSDTSFKGLNRPGEIVNGEILPEYLNELEIDSRTVKITWTINNPSHIYPADVINAESEAGANLRIYAQVTQPSELDGTGEFVINASNEGGFSGEVMFYQGKTSIMFDTPVGSGYNPEDFEYRLSWPPESLLRVDGHGPEIVLQYDDFPVTYSLSLNGSSVMMTNAVILYQAVNKATQNTYCKSIEIPVTQRIDLDVDSDNDGWLSRSPDEDNVEDINSEPGKILFVNSGDSDSDEIPDYGDGFDWDGVAGTSDDLSGAPAFDSMWLELPHDVNISDARLRIQYPLSTPDWDKCVITGTGLNPDVAGTYYRDTGSLNGNFCSNYVQEGNAYRLHCDAAGLWSIQDNTSFTDFYTSSSKTGSYMPVAGAGNPYVSSIWEKCPLGNLRIWTKQADVTRNYNSVLSGGDLVEPGEYLELSQLGLASANEVELFVEAVNPTSVGDVKVTVSMANLYSDTYIASDVNKFTVIPIPKVEIERDMAGGAVDYQTVTDENRNILPGQRINLRAKVTPDVAVDGYEWIIPGEIFANYTANLAEGTLTQVYSEDLDEEQVHFYWADTAESRMIQCNIRIAGLEVVGTADFNIKKPICNLSTTIGNAGIDAEKKTLLLYPIDTMQSGIEYTANVQVPTGFSKGYWHWVQLWKLKRRRTTNADVMEYYGSYNQIGLDTLYPYKSDATDPNNYETGATPIREKDLPYHNLPLTGYKEFVIDKEEFWMYVMFLPPGDDSMYVPIKKVYWWWQSAARNLDGEWALTAGSNGQNASDAVEEIAHPTWAFNSRPATYLDWSTGGSLMIDIPPNVKEGSGTVQGIVSVMVDTISPLTVSLSSSDTSEATVPSSLIIPAGQHSQTFTITIIDDGIKDGTQHTSISAFATDYFFGYAILPVRDNE